jgi:hypothetical protein
MANESFKIGGQLHILAFCSITATPTEGANKGKPFTFGRRTGFEANGDRTGVYLPGPDGAPLGTGVGGSEPTWSIDTELDEARRFQRHLGGGNGDGYSFVHFELVFTHAAPSRAKITDTCSGCLLLEDPTTGAQGENTSTTIGGPCASYKPGGADPMKASASVGATT